LLFLLRRVREPPDLDQLQAEGLDAVEQPVQGRLVLDRPWSTVSTGSTDARMPSKAAISESLRRPLTRIS
jgi:hypothetical protein